ncbi:hypothetical protein FisN_4Lu593 [Fistulifera solaris]|uniref:ABC transmembrane type-1 domain-containing protein n=1 Tax=Fistulifera solaris TaxID=1519565 RepID=A0A1Z5KDM6_FISSO|nr:hypothetical protein FisN_4Lu593 [Fistulifera solaris]|eukprot:GAX24232.1 hypothetical protein FisN_4Lu593 [Fistulifera solaris]
MSSSWLLSSIVVMAVVLPWILIPLAPVTLIYIYTQSYYRMSGPDLQRLDAITRSPIQASLAEGLEGAHIIRAYRKELKFAASFRHLINRNSAAMMNFLAGQRWLGFRIEIMGASLTTASSLIIILANEMLNINAGMVGLLLQWSIVFTSALNFFFLRLTDSEARLTSIERIYNTSQLDSEAAWETDASVAVLDTLWPQNGELEFDHVCMRYRSDLPLALSSVSFKLIAKSRCGIIGRTGSGKSSLIASILRITEIESGRILLDGVDLSEIGLTDVRGREHGLRVIPQDPVLYAGSLRDCIDPFHLCTDDEIILEALKAVKHQGALKRGLATLNDSIEEGGSNLSAGERQLLCLARAIIDSSTDSFIQEMLRTRFNDTTLLTIAHRLHTIMDYDTVLVMDNGRVAQFGPPKELLMDKNGIFASLVESSGPEAAQELRAIADQH